MKSKIEKVIIFGRKNMGMNMEFIKNDAYSGELDYRAFGSMLDHPTQCYKFYWLEAIMNLMLKNIVFHLTKSLMK